MPDVTPAFRAYARLRRWRLDRMRPDAVQLRRLRSLLRRASGTRFGRAHGFAGIRDVAGFQAATPLRDYAAFEREWWGPERPVLRDATWPGVVPFFALSSGTTTGATKRIPYTPEMARAAARGIRDLLVFHVLARPRSRVLDGRAVMLAGPSDLAPLAPGVREGAVSALAALRIPRWFRGRFLPDAATSAIPAWREKIRRLAPASLGVGVTALGGSPSWLLLFLEEVAALRPGAPRSLAAWYPELELIVHGGVSFAPYRAAFRRLMDGGHAETREVYSASEGFFAFADRGDGEGLRLALDGEAFFEFAPVAEMARARPRRLWIANVETGVDYALIVSTAAGLWACPVGDVVRFTSLSPPRIVVRGRLSWMLSTVGEHVIEAELADAAAAAAEAIGGSLRDFAVASLPDGRGGGRHEWLVEFAPPGPDAAARARFAAALDARLRALNDDYREHRACGFGLAAPRVRFAAPGGFEAWLALRRAVGGQNKIPRVVNDPALFADIAATLEARGLLGEAP